MFFERFREATARLPDGLIRPAAPAGPEALARAEARLGALPAEYASFLRSFDGADLFHEAIVIAGVGAAAPRALLELNDGDGSDEAAPRARDTKRARELVFAEAIAGDRFALDGRARVLRLRAGSDERIVAGSSFERWLDATVARERLLYGPDGEFAPDVFDDDGEEVTPAVALRQTERALKVDPGSAEAQHERGVALRRLGRAERALEAFTAATELDPENPWPWFDLGRTALAAGRELPRARAAFERAAALEAGPAGARLLAWAARAALAAGDEAAAATARRSALARDPALLDALARAEAQAALEGEDDARADNEALRLALAPGSAARRSLPVVTAASSRPPRSDRPPRPGPAARPRAGASPRAGRPRR
jgi:tetratricopeptide (TPR) repeat protein